MKFQRVFVFLGLCAFLTVGLSAQTPAITGVVTTKADGLPVPGATVSLVGSDVTVTTDNAGKYQLEVPAAFARAGKVQVKVEGLGLPAKIVDVDLTANAPTTTADVGLSLGFEESITVGSRSVGAAAQKAVPVGLGIGAQNIFNVFPDRTITNNSFNGIQTFPGTSPFGMNGRTIYGRVAWKM